MNIKQMEYFLAIVEQGSFYNASQHLRIAQSALGAQIRNLEDELGVVLLLRHPRGVALTETGSLFLAQAKFILDEVRRARQSLIDSVGPPRGRLTIGMTPTFIHLFAGQLTTICGHRFPDVKLTIRSSSALSVSQLVGSGEFDMGLVAGEHAGSGLEMEPLGYEDLCLVQRACGILPQSASISLAEIAHLPLIVTPSLGGFTEALVEATRRQHLELNLRAEIDSVAVILDLVRAGAGATVLPRGVALAESGIVFTVIVEPRLQRPVMLIYSKLRAPTKAEAALRGLIGEIVSAGLRAGVNERQPTGG